MQQERLRALGQMASGIAHDINNAISPVALYIESMLERGHRPGRERRARQLETMQRAIDDVAQTVARMGEFYRQREPEADAGAGQYQRASCGQVPDLTRARWSDLAQQRGAVDRDAHRSARRTRRTIMGGRERNSRSAHQSGLQCGRRDARRRHDHAAHRARPRTRGSQTMVVVEVSDDGVGMDEDTRSRCLEPFFTTKGERGTGLGLAMVYGIAQRHGAELQVDSEPGKGTTIRLLFPDRRAR